MRMRLSLLTFALCFLIVHGIAGGQVASPQANSSPQAPAPGAGPNERGAYNPGGDVTPPQVIHQVNPKFSFKAKWSHVGGVVRVRLIVDANGMPQHVEVVKAAGHGLDESAVKAVEQYRFKPATKDGKPVPVEIYVEVNFQFV